MHGQNHIKQNITLPRSWR